MQWQPPSPEQWEPPAGWVVDRPPSRRSWRNVVALGVTIAIVAAAIGGIGAAQSDMGASERSVATVAPEGPLTTPTVSPEFAEALPLNPLPPPVFGSAGEPTTGEWQLPTWELDELPELDDNAAENWKILQAFSLERLTPPTLMSCDEAVTVEDEDSYEEAVRKQWSCAHEAWRPILEDLGLPTQEPKVAFYPGASGPSACGRVEAPAFYCPHGEGTAHFGGDDMEVAIYWDLSVNDTVHHEYAHHIQKLLGIMEASENVVHTSDIDRRVELQATCWAGAMTIRNEAVEFDEDRWVEWRASLEDSIPDEEHGTLESLRYWATRGVYSTSLRDCNTFSVVPERVS